MITLTWITEKVLERVIKNKGDEFRWKKNMKNFGEKMSSRQVAIGLCKIVRLNESLNLIKIILFPNIVRQTVPYLWSSCSK